jgi:F-type H+-transporting ATPase subunit epsilon
LECCRNTSRCSPPLRTGVVTIRNEAAEHVLAVSGGFLEVLPDKVTILADAAERAEDIDEARAEEARKKAQELLTPETWATRRR